MLTRLWHHVQWALFPVGLLLAGSALIAMAKTIELPDKQLALIPLIFVLILHFFYVLFYGLMWHVVTVYCRIQIPLTAAMTVYLASIAGKYLPLRIISVTHRAAVYVHLWKRPVRRLVQASTYESFLAILAGLLITGTGILTFPWLREVMHKWQLFLFFGLVLSNLALLFPAVQKRVLQRVGQFVGLGLEDYLPPSQAVLLLTAYVIAWMLLGTGLYSLAIALKLTIDHDWLFYVQVYAIAGTAGMLVFVLPSGIGVREGIMTSLLSTRMDVSNALFLTLAARVVVTTAELAAAALGGALSVLSNSGDKKRRK